jgi:uncharacterized membrane protein YfhO
MFKNLIINIRKNKYLWYSFGIPLVLFFVLCFIEEIIPFGTKSTTMYDSSHQYVPFLIEYYTKIKEGTSMQFSFTMGMGQDFWLVWSYYLSSPLNLFLLFFDKENILIAINIITIVKIALCSFTMTYYLKNKFKKLDVSTMAFGLAYAFSAYVMSYFYNIMWTDVIFAFPILIMFFEKMIKKEKKAYIGYILTLAYCLIANYYLSIPVCIFLCLYFFILCKTEIKEFLISGIKFAFSSILAAGISAIVLLPNIYYFLTNRSQETQPATFEIMENFFTFFSKHLYLTDAQISMGFKPGANLYCGVIIIFLLFLYVCNRQIKISERIKKLILIAFLVLSMNIKVLNYIWHGFDYPTGYVNRFSFIYIFLLIQISYECFLHIKQTKIIHIMSAGTISYLFIIYTYIYERLNGEIDDYKILSYISTSILLFIYLVPVFLNYFKKIKKNTLIKFTAKVMICELCFYSIFVFSTFKFMDSTDSYKNKDNYEYLQKYVESDSLFRSEIDLRKLSNESTQYGLNGVSFFSSTINKNFATALNRLGHRAGTNFFSVKGNNNLTQLLFNIKYLYNQQDYYYSNFSQVHEKNDISLYKNNYETSYGYLFDLGYETFDYNSNTNPFILQNNLVKKATNNKILSIYKPIFSKKIIISSGYNNFTTGSYKYNASTTNDYICKVTYEKQKDEIYEINFKYICENENDIAININPSNVYACNVKVNDIIRFSDYKVANEVVTIGNLKAGDELVVNIKAEKEATEGSHTCYFAEYQKDSFDDFYNYITKEKVLFNEVKDGYVNISTTNTEEKLLFLSFPNIEGWHITDNGKTIYPEDNVFLLLKLEPGEHNIEMKYNTPFLNYGIALSVSSILILIIIVVINKKNICKNKKAESLNN